MVIRGVFVLYSILHFARISTYHHALTIDTCGYLCYGYFGCECSIVEKIGTGRVEMAGYA